MLYSNASPLSSLCKCRGRGDDGVHAHGVRDDALHARDDVRLHRHRGRDDAVRHGFPLRFQWLLSMKLT